MERKYSISEIDALREVVETKWLWGSYHGAPKPAFTPYPDPKGSGAMVVPWGHTSRTYSEPEKTKCVEELVRTHVLAGHTAEDLLASERRAA